MDVTPGLQLRTATPEDFDEILRLAYIMFASSNFIPESDDWHPAARKMFTEGLVSGTVTARVVDNPNMNGQLIASGIGIVTQRMPAFWLPTGKMGYIHWLSVEPEWRRKGLGRSIIESLLAWYTENNIERVELHSNPDYVNFYEQIGFELTDNPNMWFYVTPPVQPNM